MPTQKIDTPIQTRISLTSHALGLTASTINGKHVRVSKSLLTPACLTTVPISIHHGASGTAAISACPDRSRPFTDGSCSRTVLRGGQVARGVVRGVNHSHRSYLGNGRGWTQNKRCYSARGAAPRAIQSKDCNPPPFVRPQSIILWWLSGEAL